MKEARPDGVVIVPSHPDADPLRRVWVAVDGHGRAQALAVFVVYLPMLGSSRAYDRDMYVVVGARDRGLAMLLGEFAVGALAEEARPLTLNFSWKATSAGYALARKLGIAPDEERPAYIKDAGREYNSYPQHLADEGGYQALCEAAARLGLAVPDR